MGFKPINDTPDPCDTLAEHGRLLVRRVAQREDETGEALFTLAAGDRTNWTPTEWQALLADLDADDRTVRQYLQDWRWNHAKG